MKLTMKPQPMKYHKNSIHAHLDALLPVYPAYDVIAHGLWRDDGSWSVNDSWKIGRNCDREDAIQHLANRWEVFKVNYAPKAAIKNIVDVSYDDKSPSLLEVDCIPFAQLRNASV